MGGTRWGVGQSFPLIDTAGTISVKQQRWLGGQKTEAVNAHFSGIEFKSWALVPLGFTFHMAEMLSMLSFGIISTWANCFLLSREGSTCAVVEAVVLGHTPCVSSGAALVFWQSMNPERLHRNVYIFDF